MNESLTKEPECDLHVILIMGSFYIVDLLSDFLSSHVSLNLDFVGKTVEGAVKKLFCYESELLIKGLYLHVVSASAAQLLSWPLCCIINMLNAKDGADLSGFY